MKISILTATYNRDELIKRLYNSILNNLKDDNIIIEWLIMDDGSTDNTKFTIEGFLIQDKFIIKYFKQDNQGKMNAINNLVQYATGDFIIECDSDDYFMNNAFETISNSYLLNKDEDNIYAYCFLKYDQNLKNMGNDFKHSKSTMFDLYFKEGENGEKALVFLSEIRKKYKYELEGKERFITEARMYHKMDLKYKILCINEPIMICEYQKEGYSNNIIKQFKESPKGYFQYFKEIFEHDTSKIKFNKKLYVIKHYILFKKLAKQKRGYKYIKGLKNKLLYIIFYFPVIIMSKRRFRK